MAFACDMDLLPNCCGFYEAGHFGFDYSDIKSESWEKLLVRCITKAGGRPIIFNFMKEALRNGDDDPTGEFEEEYECEEFRRLIKTHKNVIDIGTHINPGTDNKIHTYILKDYL